MILNYNHKRSIGGNTVLSDLVSYWKLDVTIPNASTANVSLPDSHGIYNGFFRQQGETLAATTTGIINNGLLHNQLFIPSYFPMSTISGDFTISVWLQITVSNNDGAIIATDSNSTTRVIIRASEANENNWTVYVRDSAGTEYNGTATGIGSTATIAHYVFVVRSGISIEIYKNGALSFTMAIGSMGSLGSNTYIGATQEQSTTDNPAASVSGIYDEIAVYNRALDNYDIGKLYRGGSPIQYPWNL